MLHVNDASDLPYGSQGAGLLGEAGLQVIFLFLVATSLPLFAEIWMERRAQPESLGGCDGLAKIVSV